MLRFQLKASRTTSVSVKQRPPRPRASNLGSVARPHVRAWRAALPHPRRKLKTIAAIIELTVMQHL